MVGVVVDGLNDRDGATDGIFDGKIVGDLVGGAADCRPNCRTNKIKANIIIIIMRNDQVVNSESRCCKVLSKKTRCTVKII